MEAMNREMNGVPVSSSVWTATEALPADQPVTAWAIVAEILKLHPEYGRSMGSSILKMARPSEGHAQPLPDWFSDLSNLFDMRRVTKSAEVIDGRLAIWGLAKLDEGLWAELSKSGFLEALEEEYKRQMRIPPAELLRPSTPPPEKPEGSSAATSTPPAPGTPPQPPPAPPTVVGFSPPVPGYISDQADREQPDLLEIEHEVANIAHVLMYRQVEPPLALGLFGDWGSGKTFFMGKLQKYVNQVADNSRRQEAASGKEGKWCSRVAQIEFNAWHFSDANLWASLVTRIYEGLDQALNQDKGAAEDLKKKILERHVDSAKQKTVQAQSKLDEASAKVGKAEQNLQRTAKDRAEKEGTLQEAINSVPLLLADSEFAEPLDKAAKALGVPEAARSYEALEELNGELKTFSGRARRLSANLLRSPRSLWLMALFVLIVPGLIVLAVQQWGGLLNDIGKRVVEVSAFLISAFGWLQGQLDRGLKAMDRIKSAWRTARAVRQERIETDPQVLKAKKELAEAQAEKAAASRNLEAAQTELQHLQRELQELRPERKLLRLIESRASSEAYAKQLGIISLIRSDFESMSEILAKMIAERRDYQETPPIQRIILYIDDLDRCKPERVVEVLEAIYLLLYFKLFVVVVAVDPRWLRHSLAEHYPATLDERGGVRAVDGRRELSPYSTPQDYLEKIFQIPFALRPVEKAGYQSLVQELMKPLPEKQSQMAQAGESGGDGSGPTEGRRGHRRGGTGPAQPEPDDTKKGNTAADSAFTAMPERQLEFTDREKEVINRLWLMFRTPRTVKRFINIYRLLRAGLPTEADVQGFEGSDKRPGEYQVALLILAAITGFPNEAGRFLCALDAWLDQREQTAPESSTTWQEVIGCLRQVTPIKTARRARAGAADEVDPVTGARKPIQAQAARALPAGTVELANEETDSWKLMLDSMEQVTQESLWLPFQTRTLRRWTIRAARFSFCVQPN